MKKSMIPNQIFRKIGKIPTLVFIFLTVLKVFQDRKTIQNYNAKRNKALHHQSYPQRIKRECMNYAFIHVGKNGGSTVQAFSRKYGKKFPPLRCCGHGVKVTNVPPNTCFVTLARDPIERFVSGYISRWRYGCPRYCHAVEQEEWIWKTFPSPNHLGEALASENQTIVALANEAIQKSQHLKNGYEAFFPDLKKFISRVKFVGLTCDLSNDLLPLMLAVKKAYPRVSERTVKKAINKYKKKEKIQVKHGNTFKDLEYLSPLARQSLEEYLKGDYQILKEFAKQGLISSHNISLACLKRGKNSTRTTKLQWENFMKDGNPQKVREEIKKNLKG